MPHDQDIRDTDAYYDSRRKDHAKLLARAHNAHHWPSPWLWVYLASCALAGFLVAALPFTYLLILVF